MVVWRSEVERKRISMVYFTQSGFVDAYGGQTVV